MKQVDGALSVTGLVNSYMDLCVVSTDTPPAVSTVLPATEITEITELSCDYGAWRAVASCRELGGN